MEWIGNKDGRETIVVTAFIISSCGGIDTSPLRQVWVELVHVSILETPVFWWDPD